MRWILRPLLYLVAGMGAQAMAAEFDTDVDMRNGGAATYYVQGQVGGLNAIDMMVDTGSGYMTINQRLLLELQARGEVEYVSQLRGILANGEGLSVPLYAIDRVNIGGHCWLEDVQAAVFPGDTRVILGLSALKLASPFIFSLDPPRLVLSHCKGSGPLASQPAPPDQARLP